jgi:hypothetical protein
MTRPTGLTPRASCRAGPDAGSNVLTRARGSDGDLTLNGKKIMLVVVVVFLGFWMLTDPNGLADTAQSAGGNGWDLTEQLFSGVIDFFGALD